MQEKKTERAPGSYEDFVAYLGTVRTEEELFSPLTYWFVGQNCPEDVCFRPQLVEARAKELGFWQGLTFKVERWMTTSRAEAEAAGREAFQSRIGEDYAAYREKAEAARERARRRRLSSPFLYIPKCLDDIPVRDVSWLVEGLLPQGEVFLLGADGGTGKGIWQAQLVAYVTAGKTSGFFPQPPGQTGRVLIFAGEDDPSKVLKARLMAAGADMSRVMVQTQRRLLLPHRQPPVHPGQELRQVHRERRPPPSSSSTRSRAFCLRGWRWSAATRCGPLCCPSRPSARGWAAQPSSPCTPTSAPTSRAAPASPTARTSGTSPAASS